MSKNEQAGAAKRLRRTALSLWDAGATLKYCRAYLEANMYEREYEDAVREALQVAIVVSYARPFSGNQSRLPKKYMGSMIEPIYKDWELRLHEELIDRRNKVYAHTDERPFQLEVLVSENVIE